VRSPRTPGAGIAGAMISLGGDVAASATVRPFWQQTLRSAARPSRDVGRLHLCDHQGSADVVFGIVIEKSFLPVGVNLDLRGTNVCVRTATVSLAAGGIGSGAITP
jgi:hypothetical protein